jgi:hypothetical protein
MHAITAGLITAGLLLGLAATLFALITRATAAVEDRAFTRTLALAGQGCTALALVALAHYGYRPPALALDCVYAAMAATILAFATWLPEPRRAARS